MAWQKRVPGQGGVWRAYWNREKQDRMFLRLHLGLGRACIGAGCQ